MERNGAISSRQIRAARALLDWSQEDLAVASGLSIATIRKLELGHISPRHSTTHVICQAIENAGLEFIVPDGVCRQHEGILIYEGIDGVSAFFEDIYQTIKRKDGEVAVVVTSKTALFKPNHVDEFLDRIANVDDAMSIKCLLTDGSDMWTLKTNFEFRSISKQYIDPLPFYVYGDKYAIIVSGVDLSPKIIVIQSTMTAQASRRHFYSMWEKGTSLNSQIDKATNGTKISA